MKLRVKLLSSLAIVASEIGIVAAWIAVIQIIPQDFHPQHTLGIHLEQLAYSNALSHRTLFFIHETAMSIMLVIAYSLFRKTSVRRHAKHFVVFLCVALTLMDLLAWSASLFRNPLTSIVGPIGFVTSGLLMVLGMVPVWQMWMYKRWGNSTGRTARALIVGGGFAGLYAALTLNKSLGYHKDLQITLVDPNNYFLFVPLLPSASVGTIELAELSFPFRRVFETTNIIYRKLAVTKVDLAHQSVTGRTALAENETNVDTDGKSITLPYDYLVLCPGSSAETFNIKGLAQHAFFMRKLEDAFVLRNHIINCFEIAATKHDTCDMQQLLTFVIVGGGPTGVEALTEIHDLIYNVLLRRYPEIDRKIPSIMMIQSGNHILPDWDDQIIRLTTKHLNKMNIKLVLGKRVTSIGSDFVETDDGEHIACETVVWCSGIKAHPLLASLDVPLDKSGRVPVNADLTVTQNPNVFVLGDAAYLIDEKTNKPLPALAQVALQQGIHCGKNIARDICGQVKLPFSYFNYGALVSIGERNAIVKLLGLTFTGLVGWLLWRLLYLSKLVGRSNRLRVVIDWMVDLLIERSITQIEVSKCRSNGYFPS